jgi:hypothetical protein
MTWTDKQKNDLDNSMVAAQSVNLGTILGGLFDGMGVHTVTASEDSASAVRISAPIDSISGWFVQVYRAQKLASSDVKVSGSSGSILLIENGSSYNMAAGDVIQYLIF